jgi:hypothetical protein
MRPWLVFGSLFAGAVGLAAALMFLSGRPGDSPEIRLAQHLKTYAADVQAAESKLERTYNALDELFSKPDWFRDKQEIDKHLKLALSWEKDSEELWHTEERLYDSFLGLAAKELGQTKEELKLRPDIRQSLDLHDEYRHLMVGQGGRYYSAVAGYLAFCSANHATMKFREGLFYWPDTELSRRHDTLAAKMEKARRQYAAASREFHKHREALAKRPG